MPHLDVTWIHGAVDCSANHDPVLQVHAFDADTFIFRQNKCVSFEAPFMYLLIGSTAALLIDTGAQSEHGEPWPLAATVRARLEQWQIDHGASPLDLIVAHTHSHGDHLVGDPQFSGAARTRVVGPGVAAVKSFFGLTSWPSGAAALDLGNRRVVVMPIPGHEDSHIAFYDERTRVLFTGDTLYPGLLVVHNWTAYRRSAARLAEFAANHEIEFVLGAHIEMKRMPRQLYPIGTHFQPDEHVLQLGKPQIDELAAVCAAHSVATRIIRDHFIVEPV